MLKPVIGKKSKVILITLDKFPLVIGSEEKSLHWEYSCTEDEQVGNDTKNSEQWIYYGDLTVSIYTTKLE